MIKFIRKLLWLDSRYIIKYDDEGRRHGECKFYKPYRELDYIRIYEHGVTKQIRSFSGGEQYSLVNFNHRGDRSGYCEFSSDYPHKRKIYYLT